MLLLLPRNPKKRLLRKEKFWNSIDLRLLRHSLCWLSLERNFFLRISEWEGIVCVSTQRNGLKMVLVPDFQDLVKISLISKWFQPNWVITNEIPSLIIEISMKFHQIMRNQLRKLQSFHPKLTNTVSSGERGQWEYEKKDSTGKKEETSSCSRFHSSHIAERKTRKADRSTSERCAMEEVTIKKARKSETPMIVYLNLIHSKQLNVNGNNNREVAN